MNSNIYYLLLKKNAFVWTSYVDKKLIVCNLLRFSLLKHMMIKITLIKTFLWHIKYDTSFDFEIFLL